MEKRMITFSFKGLMLSRLEIGPSIRWNLNPVQTVMIVDDSFNKHTRLNTNYHALSSTIM